MVQHLCCEEARSLSATLFGARKSAVAGWMDVRPNRKPPGTWSWLAEAPQLSSLGTSEPTARMVLYENGIVRGVVDTLLVDIARKDGHEITVREGRAQSTAFFCGE